MKSNEGWKHKGKDDDMVNKLPIKRIRGKKGSGMTICSIMIAYAIWKYYGKVIILDYKILRSEG